MHSRLRPTSASRRRALPFGLALASLVGTGVVAARSAEGEAPKLGERMLDGSTAADSASATNDLPAATVSAAPSSWTFHDWHLFATVAIELRADDNLYQSDPRQEGDFIGVFSPGLGADYSPAGIDEPPTLHLDYAPSLLGYLDHSEFNALDHAAHLRFGTTFSRSFLSLEHAAALDSNPAIEQAAPGQRHTEVTSLTYRHELSGRTGLALHPNQQFTDLGNGVRTWSYGASLEASHQRTEKTSFQLAYGFGAFTTEPASDGYDQSLSGSVQWTISDRHQLSASGGIQQIVVSDSSIDRPVAPSASIAWIYGFLPKTSLSLALDHTLRISEYVAHQMNETTAARATVDWAVSERVKAQARLAGGLVAQQSTLDPAADGGDFNYWTTGLGLAYRIGRSMELRADYDYSARTENRLYDAFGRNYARLTWQYRF